MRDRRRLGQRRRGAAAARHGLCARHAPRPSSPATIRPTCRSTARSTPIAAASMAASIASRGRRHAYLGLSPGPRFREPHLRQGGRAGAARAPSCPSRPMPAKPITLGANTDAYQPVERKFELTRRILEVLREFRHPVCLITKSALVQRDIDILARDGEGAPGRGRDLGDDARPRARAPHGAARRDARAPARDHRRR